MVPSPRADRRRRLTAALGALGLLVPGPALARAERASDAAVEGPAAPQVRAADRWTRGTWTAGLGLTAGIPEGMTTIGGVVRGGHYVVTGLEVGLEAEVTVFLWNTALTAQWREYAERLPSYVVRATPTLRFTPLRREAFALYLLGGLGPTIFGRDAHVTGHWLLSPGMLIWLGGRVHLDLAFRFTQPFPYEACAEAFVDDAPPPGASLYGYCDFRFGPHLGVVFSF
ncbi:MAG: hypothetical protein H6713_06820 [Myxococcales bacterium]|nr:hypothetical protein [Myxococcales bacterium]MCB9749705.1 hypothetical protein [Myxococcales bacterium]